MGGSILPVSCFGRPVNLLACRYSSSDHSLRPTVDPSFIFGTCSVERQRTDNDGLETASVGTRYVGCLIVRVGLSLKHACQSLKRTYSSESVACRSSCRTPIAYGVWVESYLQEYGRKTAIIYSRHAYPHRGLIFRRKTSGHEKGATSTGVQWQKRSSHHQNYAPSKNIPQHGYDNSSAL